MAAIGLGYLDGFLTVPLLLALVAVISILWDFAWASSNAAPGLILTPEEQFAASGVAGAVGGATTLIGYGFGGFLLIDIGPAAGMLIYAVLLGLAAVFALPLQVSASTPAPSNFARSFREGWSQVAAGPGAPLLQLASVDAIQGLFASLPGLLVTLTSVAYFQGSTLDYGILFTTYVGGGVAASVSTGQWNPRSRVGSVLLGGLGLAAAGFGALAVLPHNLILLSLGWFTAGFATTMYTTARFAYLRGAIAPERLGRVFSNLYLFPGTAASFGAVVFGGLAVHGSPGGIATLVAVGFALAAVCAASLPGVRALRY
ncbi:MAG TPA: hypothetical protein VEY07_00175 [Thermoplasmata archaeon]|nr:hypothetical protein [Thermoplasmata archaeon]